MAELKSCNRNHMVSKAKNIYYLTLYRKSVPTSNIGTVSVAPSRLVQLVGRPAH